MTQYQINADSELYINFTHNFGLDLLRCKYRL